MKKIIIDVANHRHNGEAVAVGSLIEVDAATADWMVARNKAHYEPAPAPAPDTITKKKEQ